MPGMIELVRQSMRFGLVGVVNTSIGLAAIYALMYFLGTSPAIANAIGYAIGLAVSFALNRIWTFENTQPIRHVLPRYLFTAGICYCFNLSMVVLCTRYLLMNPYLAQLLGISIYTFCMFVGCRWYVFTTPNNPPRYRPYR